jgi:hypothetical protein
LLHQSARADLAPQRLKNLGAASRRAARRAFGLLLLADKNVILERLHVGSPDLR